MGRLSDRLNESGGITELEQEVQEVAQVTEAPKPSFAKDISETLPTVASSAMIVHIEITKWGGKVKDHHVTDKVLAQEGATSGSGIFKKSLMPHSRELQKIETLSNTLRTRNMARCLPWIGNGMGLLPTSEFDWFQDKFKECEREYTEAVNAFMDKYEESCEQAKEELGNLFDPSLYPTADYVRSRFQYRHTIQGIEEGKQPSFYQSLTDAQIETAKDSIQKQNDVYVPALTDALWDKISAPLVKLQMDALHEHLYVDTQKKLKFQQTKVTNVTKATEAVRSLNVMNDADLNKVCDMLDVLLTGITVEAIKEDHMLRDHLRNSIRQIEAIMPQ
jgi:hypothetical protein|tara:strand:- start:2399 stop:3397 length:999 start_codon:yes stop_codon:yes gene_type:complete